MKKKINQSNNYQIYWWVNLLLFIFIFSLVSIDAANGQVTNPSDGSRKVRSNGKTFKHIKRPGAGDTNRSVTCTREPNRSIDGTCNNIVNADTEVWGASDIPLYRGMTAAYGAPDFYNDMNGNCRLTPRAISNIVVAQSQDILSPRNLSSLVFTWGQFIDHDIDLTPEGETEYVPILLPANEPLFTAPIPFLRSEPYPGTGINEDRQQENIISSWMDASQVYGSEESRANWLRTFNRGKLKMSSGDLLPYNTLNGEVDSPIDPNAPSMAGDGGGTVVTFVAGDVRAAEQPGLTALHTLFVREHNRICDQMVAQGSNNDEQNYQRARKRVGAYIQAITYNRFLPALGVQISSYQGYNSNIQADISNIFAAAAYRLGHTMVTNEIPLIGTNCAAIGSGSLPLLDGFFNPSVTSTYGIEAFIQGLASQTQQKVDAKVVDNLRNFLFGDPSSGSAFGLDLASLNIQRGRDHGLPDYNSVRAYYTGFPAEDFSDITTDVALQNALRTAYGSVYDMDLWVGLLSEDHLNGSSVGITLNAILGEQFQKLRDGDYYFYRNDPAFSSQQRDQINNTSLRDIIFRNTPIQNLQSNVFFAAPCNPNGGGGGGGNGGGGGHGGGGNGGGGGGGGGNGGGSGGGLVEGSTTAIAASTLSIFPNPSDGKINISVLLQDGDKEAIIQVQGLNGKVFYKETKAVDGKTLFAELNLKRLAPGMYFITVQSGEELLSEKLVID